MPFHLHEAVPWGRSLEEYDEIFAIRAIPHGARILDVAAGPASFAAEANAHGWRVTAADPLYGCSATAIFDRFDEARPSVMEQLSRNAKGYRWDRVGTLRDLETRRVETMRSFLKDFRSHGGERYVEASLPKLPFADAAYDVALCSHFLFLNEATQGRAFTLASVEEMLRVAREIRLFPLVRMDGRSSRFLPHVLAFLERQGYGATTEAVDWHFQIGATHRLVVRRREIAA